jgi:hypothetical protein
VDHRSIAMMATSVPMTAVILQQAVLTVITPHHVTTVMPVPRLMSARVVPVQVDHRSIAMMATFVPMTAVILYQVVLTRTTPHPVTMVMPVLRLTPALEVPVQVDHRSIAMMATSVPMTAAILYQVVLTRTTPHPVTTAMPVPRLTPALEVPV